MTNPEKIFNAERFFFRLQPFPNAINILEKLSKKYNILIATNPKTHRAATEKYWWCTLWLPFIPFESIIMGGWKWMIDADWIIDDNPLYLEKFTKKTIVINKKYNKNIICDYRVNNWKEIEEVLGV